MTRTQRTRLRWLAPAAVAATIAGTVLATTAASGAPTLPPRSAAELLAQVARAHPTGLSGTVTETANLGLPALPAGDPTLGPLGSLLAGSHTLQVWYGGPGQARIAVIKQLAEYDLIANGRTVWTYDSSRNAATRLTLPARPAHRPAPTETGPAGVPPGSTAQLTPQAAAQRVLAAIGPTTTVTVDRTATVAGRSAYQLVLAPRQAGSLIRSVRIAIDAKTGVPLRVQVWGQGAKPAFETGFTAIHFGMPAASTFRFSPPRGAHVTDHVVPAPGQRSHPRAMVPAGSRPAVYGTGWTSVVRFANVAPNGVATSQFGKQFGKLTSPVPGGQLLRTALVSALLTPSGRLYVGAVTPQVLERVAAAHP